MVIPDGTAETLLIERAVMKTRWLLVTAVVLVSALSCLTAYGVPERFDKTADIEVGSARAFKALRFTPAGRFPGDAAVAVGEFTAAGPKAQGFKPVPERLTQIAFDPRGRQLFGLAGHEVFRVDTEKGAATKLDVDVVVKGEKFAWPCGITFDTKRQRLLVVTLSGVGYLYAYSPATGKWSVLTDMNNLDLAALAYEPKSDCLYGIYRANDGGRRPTLGQFNSSGALVRSIELSDPSLPKNFGENHRLATQMAAVDGQLVVVVSPGRLGGEDKLKGTYIYRVDPQTGKVRQTWAEKEAGKE